MIGRRKAAKNYMLYYKDGKDNTIVESTEDPVIPRKGEMILVHGKTQSGDDVVVEGPVKLVTRFCVDSEADMVIITIFVEDK